MSEIFKIICFFSVDFTFEGNFIELQNDNNCVNTSAEQ